MYYQLLNDPKEYAGTAYKGTYRNGPTYTEFLPLADPLNQMFLKYVDNESRFIDIDDALKLAFLYKQVGKEFDVLGVDTADFKPTYKPGNFIGFDVSIAGWWSMLSWGLDWKDISLPISPILSLIELHFHSKLNEYGLFTQWEDAYFFVEIVKSVSVLAPGTFESEDNINALQIFQLTIIKAQ